MDPLILEEVTKRFDGVTAVSKVSCRLPAGAVCGLIGPNGSGKTTTIRMILGFFAPDEGGLLVLGNPPGDRVRDRIGYMPEERGLYRKMRVDDILHFFGRLRGMGDEAIASAIAPWLGRLGLSGRQGSVVEELSKGMQQKVQFIAAVLHRPELVILDEPFSGLDPVSADVLKDAIVELKREGATVLFSTHVMEVAEKICDAVLMLDRGRKVLDGSLDEVRRGAGGDSVVLEYEGDGRFLKGLPGVSSVNDYGSYAELALAPGADADGLLRAALGAGLRVRSFATRRHTLHEIFRRATGGPDA